MTHILVIEDDPAVAGMLEMTLTVEGYDVEVINDGTAGMARLDGTVPDMVITDVMMPGADGFTILKAMRTRKGWSTVPAIVSTALKGDEDVWKGWSSGADYYLVKPFDLDQLRTVVQRLLAGEAV